MELIEPATLYVGKGCIKAKISVQKDSGFILVCKPFWDNDLTMFFFRYLIDVEGWDPEAAIQGISHTLN